MHTRLVPLRLLHEKYLSGSDTPLRETTRPTTRALRHTKRSDVARTTARLHNHPGPVIMKDAI
jgi:hypothetical protein